MADDIVTPGPRLPRADTVVFLDFDGVIRLGRYEACGFKSHFCPDKIDGLAVALKRSCASVVITSDWRNASNQDEIRGFLGGELSMMMHTDWATPICGHRWNEVQRWLTRHPEVVRYAILDDFEPHFSGCPPEMRQRLVVCDSDQGVTGSRLMEVERVLGMKLPLSRELYGGHL